MHELVSQASTDSLVRNDSVAEYVETEIPSPDLSSTNLVICSEMPYHSDSKPGLASTKVRSRCNNTERTRSCVVDCISCLRPKVLFASHHLLGEASPHTAELFEPSFAIRRVESPQCTSILSNLALNFDTNAIIQRLRNAILRRT